MIYTFFIAICKLKRVDEHSFEIISKEQKINTSLQGYYTIILEIFKNLDNKEFMEDEEYYTLFQIYDDGTGLLNIFKKNTFKNILITSIKFLPYNEKITKNKISYRIGLLNCKVNSYEERISQIIKIVKQKNPSLNIEIEKLLKKV